MSERQTRLLVVIAGNGAILVTAANFVLAHINGLPLGTGQLAGLYLLAAFSGVAAGYLALVNPTDKKFSANAENYASFAFTALCLSPIIALLIGPAIHLPTH